MPSITAGGIGSGLDINNLVSQLVVAEAEPTVNRLNRQETEAQAKLSAFGLLQGALDGFRGALTSLKQAATYTARTATSSDEEVFTVSASDSSQPGSYDVEVVKLAEAHKLASKGYTGATEEVGSGTLTISVGSDSFSISIDSAGKTLGDIRNAINGASDNTGVNATIINVDKAGGGTESKLVLTAKETGTENPIVVTVDDDDLNDTDDAGLSALVYDPDGSGTTNLTELQGVVDAQIKVDGLAVTRSSNTIDDAIEGVTISLVSAPSASVEKLTVSVDTASVTGAVNSFVSGYNSLVRTLNTLVSYDPETRQATILFGDSTARNISFQLRRELSNEVSETSSDFSSLAAIGVTTGANGMLEVDSGRLNDALADNLEGVTQLFTAEDGYAVRMESMVSAYTSFDGLISTRTEGLNNQIEDITEQRETLDRRLISLESRLLAQFTAMDQLVAQLTTTGNFLTQQITNLQALTNRIQK